VCRHARGEDVRREGVAAGVEAGGRGRDARALERAVRRDGAEVLATRPREDERAVRRATAGDAAAAQPGNVLNGDYCDTAAATAATAAAVAGVPGRAAASCRVRGRPAPG